MKKARRERIERNKLDKAWADAVKNRDGNKCVYCGTLKGQEYLDKNGIKKKARIEAAHIIPREIAFFRHNIDNGIALCTRHHKWSYEFSMHKNPFVFFVWFMRYRREQYLKLLE
jgi:predicted restriction endonuclease